MLYGQRIYGHTEICGNGTVSRLLGKKTPCQLHQLEEKTIKYDT